MTIERIGYGAGERDLEQQANLLRLLVGQTGDGTAGAEQLWIVETNLDDASGELVGYCIERLWEAGALDVYTTPIQMKKNRPGALLSVLCESPAIENVESTLFGETTTLGVRRWPVSRRKLDRRPHTVATSWGPIEGKLATAPGRAPAFSPEYDACRRVAIQHRLPLRVVMEAARRAFDGAGPVARNVVE
jgi:uncharacterized protein (DUF111 family)